MHLEEDINRREHFRLAYPVIERPKLILGWQDHEVVDLSPGGARLDQPGGLACGQRVAGTLRLRDGRRYRVDGRLWVPEDERCIVLLDPGRVTMAVVIEEQQRLIRRYRTLRWDQEERAAV